MRLKKNDFMRIVDELKVGDFIEYTGELIVMRDAAQLRIRNLISMGKKIPVPLKNSIIFYAGPAKKSEKFSSGAIGPTTSERMDIYLEMLLELGVLATVGKGKRSKKAIRLCEKYGRPYLVAPSGAAAYLASKVQKVEILAFHDLGPEAIHRLHVKDFPLLVYIDPRGETLDYYDSTVFS